MKRAGMMVVAVLTAVAMGCSFVGANPRVDLAIGGAATVGTVATFISADDEAERCHENDNCRHGAVGSYLGGLALGLTAFGFLAGAAYGFSEENDQARRAAREKRAAEKVRHDQANAWRRALAAADSQ